MNTAAADLAACRRLLRSGSKSFFAASLLLPRAVRNPACALYAFCRLADDEIDLAGDGAGDEAVQRLRERLDRVYAGRPAPVAADRALAEVVRLHAIPRALLDALIEGFEWDAAGRQYEDLSALNAYAARVAGTVGSMMALLMGVRDTDAIARACDLGVAMQLTNIARDVGEDASAGRLYLPRSWLREVGIDPETWLAAPRFDAALASVVQRLLVEAERLYARVDAGVAKLPSGCRPGINAARLLYAEIGHEVRRRGFDSVAQRAVVPGSRKFQLLLGAFTMSVSSNRNEAPLPALPETAFLVEAVAAVPSRQPAPAALVVTPTVATAAWWNFGSRAVWLIDLFDKLERLERREQLERLAARP